MSTLTLGSESTGGVILDLDGTLVDSVYQQVVAWRRALDDCGIQLSVWKIHRRIGMSGDLLINALVRETNRPIDEGLVDDLRKRYSIAYAEERLSVRPLPGSRRADRGTDLRRCGLGDRNQQQGCERRPRPRDARGAARRRRGHERAGPPCQARSRPFHKGRRAPERRLPTSSVVVGEQRLGPFGGTAPPAPSGLDCSQVATDARSLRERGPTVSTTTRSTCTITWTRSESVALFERAQPLSFAELPTD